MFNIERFHNELAMQLGYERILDAISVEESDDPMVTLKVPGNDDISFKVSESPELMDVQMKPELSDLVTAVHQAYQATINSHF